MRGDGGCRCCLLGRCIGSVLSQSPPQVLVKIVRVDESVQLVHPPVELLAVRVHRRDHPAEGADQISPYDRSYEHKERVHDLLVDVVVGRMQVAVTVSAKGGAER